MVTKARKNRRRDSSTPHRQTRRVFTRCPICGGELQATLEDFANHVVLAQSGELVDYQDAGCGAVCVYCENGHTEDEIHSARKMRSVDSHQLTGRTVCP